MSDQDPYFVEEENKPLIQLDFKKLVKKALRNWYIILAFALLGLMASFFYLRYTYPVYLIQSRVLTKASEEEELSSQFFRSNPIAQAQNQLVDEIQILQSRNLISQVIDELGLGVSYFSVGRVKDLDVYPYDQGSSILVESYRLNPGAFDTPFLVNFDDRTTYRLEWNNQTFEGRFSSELSGPFGKLNVRLNSNDRGGLTEVKFIIHETNNLINSYAQNYRVTKTGSGGNVLDLSLSVTVPGKAVNFLNKVIGYYEESIVRDKTQIAKRTTAFLNQRLNDLAEELRSSEQEMKQFVINNDLLSGSVDTRLTLQVEVLQELDAHIAQLEIYREGITSLIEQLDDSLAAESGFDFILVTAVPEINGKDYSAAFSELNELKAERNQLFMSAAPAYPAYKAIDQKIDQLQRFLTRELNQSLKKLETLRAATKNKSDSIYSELRKVPDLRIDFKGINRLLSIKEELYLELLKQREQTELSQATSVSEVKVLMNPRLVARTSATSRDIYTMGGAIGAMIPLAVMLLMVVMDTTVDNPDEVSKKTNVPVIASIGHSRSKKQIVVARESRTGMAEMFRLLRSNLNFFTNTKSNGQAGKEKQSLLVTSSVSGDGKTFVVVNMGMSMAIAGKKVCLVNIDLRKPKLARYLGREDTMDGLSTYLAGGIDLESIIQGADGSENLHFIPSGPIPPNPAELLLTEQMKSAVQQLKSIYDVVIFDAPPIGAVADAFSMEPYVDVSLFIVRYRHSQLQALELIQNVKNEQKLPNPAIVLNDAKTHQNSYSYGYGYGYGYGYYADDGKSKLRLGKWWKKVVG